MVNCRKGTHKRVRKGRKTVCSKVDSKGRFLCSSNQSRSQKTKRCRKRKTKTKKCC